MRVHRRSVTTSYENNALCDLCKFQYKRSDLRLRWDGLMVCDYDWEVRHPSDFYRNRNDTHILPWTRSDDGADATLTWAANYSDLTKFTFSAVDHEVAQTANKGQYMANTTTGLTQGTLVLTWNKNDSEGYNYVVANPKSTCSVTGTCTANLPSTAHGTGSWMVKSSYDRILGHGTISSGNTTLTLPLWTKVPGHIQINLSYKT